MRGDGLISEVLNPGYQKMKEQSSRDRKDINEIIREKQKKVGEIIERLKSEEQLTPLSQAFDDIDETKSSSGDISKILNNLQKTRFDAPVKELF